MTHSKLNSFAEPIARYSYRIIEKRISRDHCRLYQAQVRDNFDTWPHWVTIKPTPSTNWSIHKETLLDRIDFHKSVYKQEVYHEWRVI